MTRRRASHSQRRRYPGRWPPSCSQRLQSRAVHAGRCTGCGSPGRLYPHAFIEPSSSSPFSDHRQRRRADTGQRRRGRDRTVLGSTFQDFFQIRSPEAGKYIRFAPRSVFDAHPLDDVVRKHLILAQRNPIHQLNHSGKLFLGHAVPRLF